MFFGVIDMNFCSKWSITKNITQQLGLETDQDKKVTKKESKS